MLLRKYAKYLLFITECLLIVSWASPPKYIHIGGLFPVVTPDNTVNWDGFQYMAAFLMAVKEINDKKDGIEDNLLPRTKIKISVGGSDGSYFGAVNNALYFEKIAFNGSGIDACIGANADTESNAIAQIFNVFDTIQISYGSTASYLSYLGPYPYFFRTCTSEAYQSVGLASMIKTVFGWNHVSTFSSTDSYGSDGLFLFKQEAAALGIEILSTHQFQSGQKNFAAIIQDAIEVGGQIFLMFMSSRDASLLLEQGYDLGLFREGTQILGSALMTVKSTWNAISSNRKAASIMKGYIGLLPAFDLQSVDGQSFVQRWRSQQDTMSVASDGSEVCDGNVDDDGQKLYQRSSSCAGLRFSHFAENGSDIAHFAPYSYDATYALARGFHELLYVQNKSSVNGQDLGNALLYNVSFTGVTGNISFRGGDPNTGFGYGDRNVGYKFRIVNFDPSLFAVSQGSAALSTVGIWSQEQGFEKTYCGKKLCSFVFNTADNSQPTDTPAAIVESTSTPVQIAYFVIFAVCFVVTLGFFLFTVWYRERHVIAMAQPRMLLLILLGGILGSFRVLIGGLVVTSSTCIAGLWMSHLCFWLMFSALLAKTWRVHCYDNVKYVEWHMLLVLASAVTLVCVLLFLETTMEPPTRSLEVGPVHKRVATLYERCGHALPSTVGSVLLGLEGFALLIGAYLCFVTLDESETAQDSKHVANGMGQIFPYVELYVVCCCRL